MLNPLLFLWPNPQPFPQPLRWLNDPPAPNSNLFKCIHSDTGGLKILKCFVGQTWFLHPEHFHRLFESSVSFCVNSLNAAVRLSICFFDTSNARSKKGSYVLLLYPHLLHLSCERKYPPNIRWMKVVSSNLGIGSLSRQPLACGLIPYMNWVRWVQYCNEYAEACWKQCMSSQNLPAAINSPSCI